MASMLSVIFGKAWRLSAIFNNPSLSKKVAITNKNLIMRCFAVISAMAMLVIIWMLVDPPKLVVQVSSTSGNAETILRGVLTKFEQMKMIFEPKDQIEIYTACSER